MTLDQQSLPAVERFEEACGGERLRSAAERDTSSAQPADQFDLFRGWYADIVEIKLIQEESRPFPAHQRVWKLGKLTFTHLEVPEVRLGWRHLSKPIIDNWYLHLPLSKSRFPGDDLAAGNLCLRSSRDPFECVSEKSDHLTLCMPRNLHFIQSSRIELRENLKRFLTDYLLLLHRSLPDVQQADEPYVAAATISILEACLTPSRDHIAEAQRPIEAVIMKRVSQIIAKNLSNPALTPNLLCSEIGMSRSGLYRIFEPVGGVSAHIRRARLHKTHGALVDNTDGRPISVIAEQYGFMNSSTYSRMFKKEFGITPSEAREKGWLSVELAPSIEEALTLRDCLVGND